jgi:hypothetical protein
MSTLLVIVITVAVAGALAWTVQRYDASREPKPTDCSRSMEAVFADASSNVAGPVLLSRMLVNRDKCMDDVGEALLRGSMATRRAHNR